MSKVLDTKNFAKGYIDGKGVSEMFFDNELIYVASKKEPEITCTVEKATTPLYFKLTYQFEDWAHKLRYFDATGDKPYGFVVMQTFRLGNRILTINTSGKTLIYATELSKTGSFVSTKLKATNVNTQYTIRAFMQYKDKNGRTQTVYSPQKNYKLADLS